MQNVNRRNLIRGLACGSFLAAAGDLAHVWAAGVVKDIRKLKPGEFTWHPERSPAGPVAIIVSIPDQRVHVYRNGIRIAVSTCSTGKPGHETPTGVFTILEKDKDHKSSTYNNAPMPNMNRLTWSGVALHAGNLPGYPASHGCVRLPIEFSKRLFTVTHVGTPVILAGSHAEPKDVTHPGLVLSNYAEAEFTHVKSGLNGKALPWQTSTASAGEATSIIISSASKTATVLSNGNVVTEGTVEIKSPETPLGSHVFILKGASTASQGLQWHTFAYLDSYNAKADAAEVATMKRITAEANVQRAVRERLHPGMLIVLTDLPAHPDTRTNSDFVLMTQDGT